MRRGCPLTEVKLDLMKGVGGVRVAATAQLGEKDLQCNTEADHAGELCSCQFVQVFGYTMQTSGMCCKWRGRVLCVCRVSVLSLLVRLFLGVGQCRQSCPLEYLCSIHKWDAIWPTNDIVTVTYMARATHLELWSSFSCKCLKSTCLVAAPGAAPSRDSSSESDHTDALCCLTSWGTARGLAAGAFRAGLT